MKARILLPILSIVLVGCGIHYKPVATLEATQVLPTPSTSISLAITTHSPGSTKSIPSKSPQPSSTLDIAPAATRTRINTLVPSPTATFDAFAAITRTPGNPAECPQENPELEFSFTPDPDKFCFDAEAQVLDFLNAGGQRKAIINEFSSSTTEQDLTGDGISELVIEECRFRIYSCANGKYAKVLDAKQPEGYSRLFAVQDMNLDGVSEIIVGGDSSPFSNSSRMYYQIFEWDGEQFRNLIEHPDFYSRYGGSGIIQNWLYSYGVGEGVRSIWDNWSLQDTDKNGTMEFVLNSGLPTSFDGQANGPWRAEIATYMWNGKNFVLHSDRIQPPQYCFQAVQDADFAFLDGNYDEALDLFQRVIDDDKLDWWSKERRSHEYKVLQAQIAGNPTPTPLPPDSTEYDNLAAYAYYRIMLVYIFRDMKTEAEEIYNTLQEKYPIEKDGYSYAKMATIFWENYQISKNKGAACSIIVEYVKEHPKEVFTYLGDSAFLYDEEPIHGWQSKTYLPEDICPFK
jgi:tetratricopeptide (TPR) repeat protein